MRNLTTTICLTVALLFGCTGVCKNADFQKGQTAYESGDYATALRELKPLAEQGNARAQSNLGFMYYKEKGLEKYFE
jgi:TPR repeat protein